MFSESETTSEVNESMQSAALPSGENQLHALKSLALLLMREVESLDKSSVQLQSRFSEDRINLANEMERFEIDLIRHAMIRAKGNQRVAARILGTKATTLNAKIKRFSLEDYSVLGRLDRLSRQ
jgi:transcriptional regulator with GAF, ATPase, and Fis domain